LRERPEDIPILVSRMMDVLGHKDAFARIAHDSLDRLMRHDWPGNVRELRNVVAVGLAFANKGPIDLAAYLIPAMTRGAYSGVLFKHAKSTVLARFEREYFTALFAECDGNISEVGRRAGMERTVARDYLRRHGISRS
jgi:DNA-binding NtrC family response regulator